MSHSASPGRSTRLGLASVALTVTIAACAAVASAQDGPESLPPLPTIPGAPPTGRYLGGESPDYTRPTTEPVGPGVGGAGIDVSPGIRPNVIGRPLESAPPLEPQPPPEQPFGLLRQPFFPPLGFAGRSGVTPTEPQVDSHFVPVEDRWRLGFPAWDRYGKGNPPFDDYPYYLGSLRDPYNQNVLKGDYPILGQHTFLELTAFTAAVFEPRQIPTPTTPFESTARPFEEQFFGRPSQFFYSQNFGVSIDLFRGDAAFKPPDWRVKLTPIFNVNNLNLMELAVVNPNVLNGVDRVRTFLALEEYFVEKKLADLSPDYDFMSIRVGSQFFVSDFRGFNFFNINRGYRLFGTRFSNRDQFNVVYFDMQEKDINSLLNTFRDRNQNVLIANYYRQDFLFPGYTAQASVHYNYDGASFLFDANHFLVRPSPVGIFYPHAVQSVYLGWAGDGHIGRYNITHQLYYALGRDELNPLAGRSQRINAAMAAVELSYDRDWARFKTSFFWASGDHNINNGIAGGFDSIFDNPNFAGGQFSYWNRQFIPLFGVPLVNRLSLVPDLRNKFQGQANFVNPGLVLYNFGIDMDLTQKVKLLYNTNFLWFDATNVLEQFLFDGHIDNSIGADLSIGLEYRPLLSDNVIVVGGVSTLLPGNGFRDLFNNLYSRVDPLVAGFLAVTLAY